MGIAGPPTRISEAAQVSTGTAGTMFWLTVSVSAARPSPLPPTLRAATFQARRSSPSGAATCHGTGTALPAGIVTVSGGAVPMRGKVCAVAVTRIARSDPLRSVKLAPYQSPERTSGGTPE